MPSRPAITGPSRAEAATSSSSSVKLSGSRSMMRWRSVAGPRPGARRHARRRRSRRARRAGRVALDGDGDEQQLVAEPPVQPADRLHGHRPLLVVERRMRRGQRLDLDRGVADVLGGQRVAERLQHRRLARPRRPREHEREHQRRGQPADGRRAAGRRAPTRRAARRAALPRSGTGGTSARSRCGRPRPGRCRRRRRAASVSPGSARSGRPRRTPRGAADRHVHAGLGEQLPQARQERLVARAAVEVQELDLHHQRSHDRNERQARQCGTETTHSLLEPRQRLPMRLPI